MMGNSGSSQKITAQDKAILDMKTQRDKLHQYQKRITGITTREHEIAKELLRNGDKQKALLALRRKKFQESLLAKTDAQLAQLEMLTVDVEFARIQKDVLFGLQQGTSVLKEIQKEMGGIENVEKLIGENADAIAYQKEVSDTIGGRMSIQEEEEVEDELEELEAEMSAYKLPISPRRASDVLEDALPDASGLEEPRKLTAQQEQVQATEPLPA